MERNYYEVLEVQRDATLKDIKKAYRRLAVLYHPDRNLGNEEGATVQFREVNEAYQVLSDDTLRKEYNASLRRGGSNSFSGSSGHASANNYKWTNQSRGGGAAAAGWGGGDGPFDQFNDAFRNDPFFTNAFQSMDTMFNMHFDGWAGGNSFANRASIFDHDSARGGNIADASGGHRRYHQDLFRDPFDQFNDVFRNDPFFADAFQSMDDLFNTRFNGWAGGKSAANQAFKGEAKGIRGMLNYSPKMQVTTTSSRDFGGKSRTTTRSYGTTTTTSRSTSTIIQNGRRVTIQSLEKDGNRIEEKYVDDTLIERTVNGRKEDIGRIESGRKADIGRIESGRKADIGRIDSERKEDMGRTRRKKI